MKNKRKKKIKTESDIEKEEMNHMNFIEKVCKKLQAVLFISVMILFVTLNVLMLYRLNKNKPVVDHPNPVPIVVVETEC